MRGGSPASPEPSSGRYGISRCPPSSPGTAGRARLPSLMKTRKTDRSLHHRRYRVQHRREFRQSRAAPGQRADRVGRGRGKEHGLGFLLDSLAEFGLPATFLSKPCRPPISAMNRWARSQGGSPRRGMTCNCTCIRAGCIMRPPRKTRNAGPDNSCAGRTDAELDRFFRSGLATFSRWGLPHSDCRAARQFSVRCAIFTAPPSAAGCV